MASRNLSQSFLTRGRHGGGRVRGQGLPHEAVGLLLLLLLRCGGRLVMLGLVVRQGLIHVRRGGRRVEVDLQDEQILELKRIR